MALQASFTSTSTSSGPSGAPGTAPSGASLAALSPMPSRLGTWLGVPGGGAAARGGALADAVSRGAPLSVRVCTPLVVVNKTQLPINVGLLTVEPGSGGGAGGAGGGRAGDELTAGGMSASGAAHSGRALQVRML